MKRKDIDKALEGHANAAEIRAVLDSPVEDHEVSDRRQGYVVGDGEMLPDVASNALYTVHRLDQWYAGWDAEAHAAHEKRRKAERARHGLQFLERPHRKGRFAKATPATRRKVVVQYKAQVAAEAEGEEWTP